MPGILSFTDHIQYPRILDFTYNTNYFLLPAIPKILDFWTCQGSSAILTLLRMAKCTGPVKDPRQLTLSRILDNWPCQGSSTTAGLAKDPGLFWPDKTDPWIYLPYWGSSTTDTTNKVPRPLTIIPRILDHWYYQGSSTTDPTKDPRLRTLPVPRIPFPLSPFPGKYIHFEKIPLLKL
jgi:hypothetical protein